MYISTILFLGCSSKAIVSTLVVQCRQSLFISSVAKLKQDFSLLVTKLQKVTDDTSDVAFLKAGMIHVTNAVAVMKSMMENCSTHDKQLVPRKRVAPNENNDVQPRFHSTRKKRKTSKVSLSKPTVSVY